MTIFDTKAVLKHLDQISIECRSVEKAEPTSQIVKLDDDQIDKSDSGAKNFGGKTEIWTLKKNY